MIDFDTAVQTVISPVVTLPVIAVLTIALVLVSVGSKRLLREQRIMTGVRLMEQASRHGKITNKLLKAVVNSAEKEMDRRAAAAVEFTYNTLKNIGFDKLAAGNVSLEEVISSSAPTRQHSMLLDEAFNELEKHLDSTSARHFGELPADQFLVHDDEPLHPDHTDDNAGGFDSATRAEPTERRTVEMEDAAGLEGGLRVVSADRPE